MSHAGRTPNAANAAHHQLVPKSPLPKRLPVRVLIAVFACVAMIVAVLSTPATADEHENEEPRFRALVFSKVTNFYHSSIPAGQALIEQLGTEHDFEVVVSDDSSMFNDADLATFDVVIFNNTNSTPASGDLLDTEQRAAFQRYIQGGGGFTGLHAATAAERDWEWYEGLVGSIFTNHPAGQNPDGTIDGRVKVTDRVHPSTRNLPELWEYEEEWYNWNQRVVGDVHVLTWVDTKVGIAGLTEGPNHPFSWCQNYDGGRSWYTAAGHSPAAFSDPEFTAHLLGGIEWSAGVEPGDCGATEETSYDKVLIADNPADPMALDFLSRDEVVFVERGGAVKVIDQTDLGVTVAGTLDVYTPDSDGLLGLAVDPNFAQNRWLYLMYSHPTEPRMQVSRFTLGEDNLLDMASEQVLLEIPTYRGLDRSGVHMGGILKFDGDGNLYIGTGDNADPFASSGYAPIDEQPGREHFDAQSTSANTADLRGKILRITPQPDGTYTVPGDNLFTSGEWDHLFPGETYDENIGRSEIYAMGFRNPFRFTVDQATGNVMVADHSPDARSDSATRGPQAHGKWAVITEPSNYGWPYCLGADLPFVDYDFATGQSGEAFDCTAPVNDSPNNSGLEQLPSVAVPDMVQRYGETPAWPEFGTGGIAPVGGPVYHFDASLESDTKFPEYFDGKWFIAEWDRRWVKTASFLDQDYGFERYPDLSAGYPYSVDPWGIDQTWVRPMDMEFGPDGAMYVIEWGSNFGGNLRGQPNDDSGIYRIDYVAGNRPPKASASATPTDGQAPLTVQFSSEGTEHPSGDPISLHWDFGDETTSTEPNPTHTYTENGEYTARLTVTDDEDRTAVAVVNIVVGNTRPEVTLLMPPDGGFFEFGDQVPYEVAVSDAEDGSIADGDIDCGRVELLTLLGHDDHAHPLDTFEGCTGTAATLTDGGHGEDQNLYYVLEGIYVDDGGDGANPVPTLTGADDARLRAKSAEAEHFDVNGGVTVLDRPNARAGARLGEIRPEEWIAFDPVSLYGIDSVTVGASSAGQGGFIELRQDSPDGPVLGSVEVVPTSSWDDVQELTIDLDDPGQTFALYVVFQAPSDYDPSGPDLLSVDWFEFNGEGVADTSAPQVTVSADPLSGQAPLDVSFTGSATSPIGNEMVAFDWEFGDGSAGTGEAADHTYTEPGDYHAVLTATDSDGNEGDRGVTITVTEPDPGEVPVCRGQLSDEFDDDALDRDRWTKIVREDPDAYNIGGGALTLPTVPGRLYSTQNNDGTNIVLQPMPDGEWVATTKVTVDAAHQYQKAGIIVYGDDDNYVRANIVGTGTPPDGTPTRQFEFIYENGGEPRNQAGQDSSPALPSDFPATFYLRVTSDGENVTAAYSADGQNWESFGRPAPLATIPDPHVGLFSNKSHTTAEVIDADFDWFRVSPDEPIEPPGRDDEFDGDDVDACRWDRIIRPEPGDFWVEDGSLYVNTTSGGNFGANNEPATENQFLQTVAPDEDWVIETKVDAPLEHRFQQVGLQYYQDDANYVKLDVVADNSAGSDSELRVELRSEIDDVPQTPLPNLQPAPANTDDVWWLRLAKEGDTFTGSVSTDGDEWVELPETVQNDALVDGAYGLIHQGRTQQAPVTVAFDHFRVIEEPEVTFESTKALVAALSDDGTLDRPLEIRLSVHLWVAEFLALRGNTDLAQRTLDRFIAVASDVDDEAARIALVSAAEALKDATSAG